MSSKSELSETIKSNTISVSSDEAGLPLPRAIFVVTNAALGAGMLNFPEAYSRTGGVAEALAVQAVNVFVVCLFVFTFIIELILSHSINLVSD